MKVEQVSKYIWSLKSWMVVPVRVWLVVDEEGITLVDAGASFMAKGILQAIEQLQSGPLQAGPLQRIVLTHGHPDHIGSILKIRERFPVPVYAHAVEIPYAEGQLPYPRRKKPQDILPKGLVQPLEESVDGEQGSEGTMLQTIGGLTPYFAPGHSPGHVVFYHEQDRVLLTGDLFTSKKGKLNRPMPMFTVDMAQALRSSRVVEVLRPERLEVCHAKPVFHPADHLEAYIRQTAAAYQIAESDLK